MIEAILPRGVESVCTRDDLSKSLLFPEQAVLVRDSADSRRREFVAARVCAHRAIRALGGPATAVLPGPRGRPLWPPGLVGSIMHCAGYRAAAVARQKAVVSVGIDAEVHEALPDGVLDAIATPFEGAWVRMHLRRWPELFWDRLLFSAKEAVYKAWSGLIVEESTFKDLRITLNRSGGWFRADVATKTRSGIGLPPRTCEGRWLVGDGLAVTVVILKGKGGTS